jgi:hypothetical protein
MAASTTVAAAVFAANNITSSSLEASRACKAFLQHLGTNEYHNQ